VPKTAISRPASQFNRVPSKRAPRYRVWEPVGSPVRIEYSDEVLREAARHARGVLYGIRTGAAIRVVAARREQPRNRRSDPRIAKLELLGTFAFRERGEIFMTEPDLEHLELTGGSIALVVAGTNAGFFVYEPDGAMETIKSYREFSIADRPPAPRPHRNLTRLWISLACVAALATSVAHIPRRAPLTLTVREDAHQLRIAWPADAFDTARLEIGDGAQQTWIPVAGKLSSATYVRQSGDVNIRLIADSRVASAHFVGADASPELEKLKQLESEAASLRADLKSGIARISTLQTAIDKTLAKLNE
jgi:hypothetical protein